VSARGEPSPSCVASAPVSARLVMQRARGACAEAWEGGEEEGQGEEGQQGRRPGDVDQDGGAPNDGERYITYLHMPDSVREHISDGDGAAAHASLLRSLCLLLQVLRMSHCLAAGL
jgi:hypothetical protein